MNRKIATMLLCSAALVTPTALLADKASNSLVWAATASMTSPDPYYSTDREVMVMNGQLVWDTLLLRPEGSDELAGLLATEWRWIDDTTLEFDLRTDVRFHDGQPMGVDDVVYTVNYIADPENRIPVQSNVSWLKDAEKVDDDTVRIHLDAPFPAALEYLASVIAILPVDFYGPDGKAGGNGRLVGSGPYKITDFASGSHFTVQRSDSYFADSPKGQPKLDSITFRTIPDQSTQVAELMSGGVDWVYNIPAELAQPLQGFDQIEVRTAETMRVAYLAFNTLDRDGTNPLADRRVREAVSLAIDRQAIVDNVIGEGAYIPKSACHPRQFGCFQDTNQIDFDPVRAAELLREAGYSADQPLQLISNNRWNRQWVETVSSYLTAAGIANNVTPLSYPALRERVANGTADMVQGDWAGYSIPDASVTLNLFFTGQQDDMNRDPEVIDWLKAASSTVDPKAREALYQQALSRISDQIYWLPLWVHPIVYAYADGLTFAQTQDENPRFYSASWAQ